MATGDEADRSVEIRAATDGDLEQIIEMTRAARRRLAEWAPVYFRPREGADELHAAFLAWVVGSGDHDTRVMVDSADDTVGFFQLVPQPARLWIDDLCIGDPGFWPPAIGALIDAIAEPEWVTCVATADLDRIDALTGAGLRPLSGYHALSLEPSGAPTASSPLPTEIADPAPHTFGVGSFDPNDDGALVVSIDGGYAVGSRGVEPPIYDPGGPSCVVDRLVGSDRAAVLDAAISTAAARGDAGLIVVRAAGDDALRALLDATGFSHPVDLYGARPTAP